MHERVNLKILLNSMCKRIDYIVLFNLHRSFKTRNGAIFKYLKEDFILGGTTYTSHENQ